MGPAQAMELGYRTRLIIPGITMIKIGRIFKNPAKIEPALAWMLFFAPRVRCTITCNLTKNIYIVIQFRLEMACNAVQFPQHMLMSLMLCKYNHMYNVAAALPGGLHTHLPTLTPRMKSHAIRLNLTPTHANELKSLAQLKDLNYYSLVLNTSEKYVFKQLMD